MKYVLNKCYGGFGLSTEAFEWLMKEKDWKVAGYNDEGNYADPTAPITDSGSDSFGGRYYLKDNYQLEVRCNPDLVECIETLGEKANGMCADLQVVDCPLGPTEGIEIDEYDGIESLQTIPDRW